MKRYLTPLFLFVSSSAFAQDIPNAVANLISDIGLEQADWHPGRERPDLEGYLPGGTYVEFDFNHSNEIEEIEAAKDGFFNATLIAKIVPQVLKDSPDYPRDAKFQKVELGQDKFEIKGLTAEGDEFEAKYDGTGQLEKWERK